MSGQQRPGACATCGVRTSRSRITRCRACASRASQWGAALEVAWEGQRASAEAHLDDVLWLIDSGLPCWEVARRFDVTVGAIAKLLYRRGYPDKARPFERMRQAQRRQIEREERPDRPRGFGRHLAPCGTYTAYRRHLNWNEPVDDACREAMRVANAGFRAKRRAA